MVLNATIDPINRKVVFEEVPFSGRTDKAVTGIRFSCPNDIGISVDLNDMLISVRYANGRKELFTYYFLEKSLVDGNVIFTWILDEPANRYDGTLYFNICAEYTANNSVKRWNTQISTIEVFKTLDEGDAEPTQEQLDDLERLLGQLGSLITEYEEAVQEAENTAVQDAQDAATRAEAAARLAIAGTPDGFAALVADVGAFDSRLVELARHMGTLETSATNYINTNQWQVFSTQTPTFYKINNVVTVNGSLQATTVISVERSTEILLMTAPSGFRPYVAVGFRQNMAHMGNAPERGDYFIDFRTDGSVYLKWSTTDQSNTAISSGTVVAVSATYLCEDAEDSGAIQNEELLDARIAKDGTVFSSAGSHIRSITPVYDSNDDILYLSAADSNDVEDDEDDNNTPQSLTYTLQREGENAVLRDVEGNLAGSIRLSSLAVEEALASGSDGNILVSDGLGGVDWASVANDTSVVNGSANLPGSLTGRTWTNVASITLPSAGVWFVTFSFQIDADQTGDFTCQIYNGENDSGIRNRQSIYLNGSGQAATANVTVPVTVNGQTVVNCRVWTNVVNSSSTIPADMWSSAMTMVRAVRFGTIYTHKEAHIPDLAVKGINHRGYSIAAPENTLSAFRLSKKMGFEYVECDVSFTSDGVAVLLHDSTINRTSNGTGNINNLTFAQVRGYDFGSWFSARYSGEKIPSFEEFIALCRTLGLKPYIELKSSATYSQTQITNLVTLVKRYAMNKHSTWISFNATYLGYVKTADPNARLGYLVSTSSITDSQINTAVNLKTGTNEVFMDSSSYSQADINKCMNAGLPLEIWTIDSETVISNAHAYVSGVTSNSLRAAEVLYKSGGMASI